MAVTPPLCKTCQKREWNHVCRGVPKVDMKKLPPPVKKPKKVTA